jgi:hypothetical protein
MAVFPEPKIKILSADISLIRLEQKHVVINHPFSSNNLPIKLKSGFVGSKLKRLHNLSLFCFPFQKFYRIIFSNILSLAGSQTQYRFLLKILICSVQIK